MYPGNTDRIARAGRALLAAGFLCATWVGVAGAWTLEKAMLEERAGDLVFQVHAPQAGKDVPCDVFTLDHPDRVVVDLFGADAPLAVEGETAAAGLVSCRSSLWKDEPAGKVVRYVFETSGPMSYRCEPADGDLSIHLTPVANPVAPEGANPPSMPPGGPTPGSLQPGAFEPDASSPETPATNTPATNTPMAPASSGGHATPPTTTTTTPTPTPVVVVDPGLNAEDLAPAMGDVDPSSASSDNPAAPSPSPVMTVSWGAAKALVTQPGSVPGSDTKPMNLDVQEADLKTVFRSIAEFGGMNIVPDRDVQGPVSIRLVQTPWRQALDIVCESADLVALDGDGYIRVATIRTYRDAKLDRDAAERKREDFLPLDTKVFTARYASVAELKDAIIPALTTRGLVDIDERTNSLIVRDIEPRLEQVAGLVAQLDTETKQVEIVAKLIDIDATADRQLGISWMLNNLHSNSERVSGSGQVNEALPTAASGTVRVGVVRGWGDLEARIEALERTNKANIISNPKITTTTNRKAKILIGKEIPLITLDERGNPITELKKVGITLEVTPYINSDNRITMDLHPEVSDLSSQATVTGGLIFTTTQADTRVMVSSGETAVIGGLIRTNETKFKQGIPILKDIPLLGALFRSSDTRNEKRELVIMVTPTIVEPVASK